MSRHSDKRHFTVRSQRKENLRSHQRWKEWRHWSPGSLGPQQGGDRCGKLQLMAFVFLLGQWWDEVSRGRLSRHSDKRHFTMESQRNENLRSHQRWKEVAPSEPRPPWPSSRESATALARAARQHGCPPQAPSLARSGTQPCRLATDLCVSPSKLTTERARSSTCGQNRTSQHAFRVARGHRSHDSLPRRRRCLRQSQFSASNFMQRYVWDVE